MSLYDLGFEYSLLGLCRDTGIDVHYILGWYPESTHNLTRLYIVSSITSHAHLHALPVRPDMPGAFSWAAVNIASLTSLLVTLLYTMLLGSWFMFGSGSSSRWEGVGKR